MIAIPTKAKPKLTPKHQQLFVDKILPHVEQNASIRFRHLKGQARDDAIQEATAIAWQLFVQAVESGKSPTTFPTYIAAYAVRRVKSGRLFAGQSPKDAFSPVAQQRHGFQVHSIDDESCDPDTGWKAVACSDTREWPVPDVVAFRIDFSRWLESLPRRTHKITGRLMVGDRPGEVARMFGISPSRVSQIRRALKQSWTRLEDGCAVGVAVASGPA